MVIILALTAGNTSLVNAQPSLLRTVLASLATLTGLRESDFTFLRLRDVGGGALDPEELKDLVRRANRRLGAADDAGSSGGDRRLQAATPSKTMSPSASPFAPGEYSVRGFGGMLVTLRVVNSTAAARGVAQPSFALRQALEERSAPEEARLVAFRPYIRQVMVLVGASVDTDIALPYFVGVTGVNAPPPPAAAGLSGALIGGAAGGGLFVIVLIVGCCFYAKSRGFRLNQMGKKAPLGSESGSKRFGGGPSDEFSASGSSPYGRGAGSSPGGGSTRMFVSPMQAKARQGGIGMGGSLGAAEEGAATPATGRRQSAMTDLLGIPAASGGKTGGSPVKFEGYNPLAAKQHPELAGKPGGAKLNDLLGGAQAAAAPAPAAGGIIGTIPTFGFFHTPAPAPAQAPAQAAVVSFQNANFTRKVSHDTAHHGGDLGLDGEVGGGWNQYSGGGAGGFDGGLPFDGQTNYQDEDSEQDAHGGGLGGAALGVLRHFKSTFLDSNYSDVPIGTTSAAASSSLAGYRSAAVANRSAFDPQEAGGDDHAHVMGSPGRDDKFRPITVRKTR